MKRHIQWVNTGISLLLMLVCSTTVWASENALSAQEQENLTKAIYCMEILENRPDMAADKRLSILKKDCFAEQYIQHSPHVPDGRDAVLALFEKRYENHPQTSISIKRTASQGDLVWIHMHFKRSPEHRGNAIIHIFRMEDGKFAEHWAVGQPVPETAKNTNSMF